LISCNIKVIPRLSIAYPQVIHRPKGGDHVEELRDYEVILKVRVVTVCVSGGTKEAEEVARKMVIQPDKEHYCRAKTVSVSDLGLSEKQT